jgi:hypothetical protein
MMKTKTQYFKIPERFTSPSSILIKFDGEYSYWGIESRTWIYDPTVLKQDWIHEHCIPITRMEANEIIKQGAPSLIYRHKNPKMVNI